jgi:periplasmic protein TonB
MFQVVSGQRRRKTLSPAGFVLSLAAHAAAVGGLFYASGIAGPPPPPEVEPPLIWVTDPPVELEPAPSLTAPPPPAAPDPDGILPTEGDRVELDPPREVPDGIVPEAPGTPPIDIATLGDGAVTGDIIGTPAMVPLPRTGSTAVADPGDLDVIPESMVETMPRLERDGLARLMERHYPATLRSARMSGRVLVELIVEVDGSVRPGSMRVVEASHPGFSAATLRAADRFRFAPARVGGVAVPVRVTIPVEWTARS